MQTNKESGKYVYRKINGYIRATIHERYRFDQYIGDSITAIPFYHGNHEMNMTASG